MRHWRRELHNRPARACATAFPRRVLYSRGTPGMMMPVTPTAMGAASFSAQHRAGKPSTRAYRGCGDQPVRGPTEGVVKLRDHDHRFAGIAQVGPARGAATYAQGPRGATLPAMSKKPTFRGRVLSPSELKQIRREIEGFETIDVIDDDMRELIEQQWPDLAGKLPPRKPS